MENKTPEDEKRRHFQKAISKVIRIEVRVVLIEMDLGRQRDTCDAENLLAIL